MRVDESEQIGYCGECNARIVAGQLWGVDEMDDLLCEACMQDRADEAVENGTDTPFL